MFKYVTEYYGPSRVKDALLASTLPYIAKLSKKNKSL
jgi:hypothetical protein